MLHVHVVPSSLWVIVIDEAVKMINTLVLTVAVRSNIAINSVVFIVEEQVVHKPIDRKCKLLVVLNEIHVVTNDVSPLKSYAVAIVSAFA